MRHIMTLAKPKVRRCYIKGYQLEKKEIPDDVPWIHFLPFPGHQSSVWGLSEQWAMFKKSCLILARHGKVKKSL
jgi:hypothetical protein